MSSHEVSRLFQPTDAQRDEWEQMNAEAKAAAEAQRAAAKQKDAEAAADRAVKLEADFKADVRTQYVGLSDADFERLWASTLRDQELMKRAAAALARRRDAYANLI